MFNIFGPSGRDSSIRNFSELYEKFFGSDNSYAFKTVTYTTQHPNTGLKYNYYKTPEIDKQCASAVLDKHTFGYSKGDTVYFIHDNSVVKATVDSRQVNIQVYDDPNIAPSYYYANSYNLTDSNNNESKFFGVCQSRLYSSIEEMCLNKPKENKGL